MSVVSTDSEEELEKITKKPGKKAVREFDESLFKDVAPITDDFTRNPNQVLINVRKCLGLL